MNPSASPRPPPDAAYQVQGNPVTLTRRAGSEQPVVQRVSQDIQDAMPPSFGRGVQGKHTEEPRFISTQETMTPQEGEKMQPPAEGRMADVVTRKPGASGSQPDLAGDLDRKKWEQAAARRAVREERRHGEISDGVVRGGVDTELDKCL
ncbi:hypothetical protein F4861DRAFT_300522 [Xylaria intraflava]|nr:hypothetical protein F4861DRAFT_300522 [Xylaria intraflava]